MSEWSKAWPRGLGGPDGLPKHGQHVSEHAEVWHGRVMQNAKAPQFGGFTTREKAIAWCTGRAESWRIAEIDTEWGKRYFPVRQSAKPRHKSREAKPERDQAAIVEHFTRVILDKRDPREALSASAIIGMQDAIKQAYARSQAIRAGMAK